MKKSFSLLLIFVITAVSLCSCAMFGNTNLMRGTITDNTYTNTSLGITLTLPDGWRFYSTSEIASVMNITKEILEDPDILDSTDISTFMDFMAVDAKETNNINMSIENLATTGNQNLSDEELLAMLQEQVQQQLPSAQYTFSQSTTVTLGNGQFLKTEAQCTYSGIRMSQYIYIRKLGNHAVAITATVTDSSLSSSDIEAMFS